MTKYLAIACREFWNFRSEEHGQDFVFGVSSLLYCSKAVVRCPRGSISTSFRTVGVTYLELRVSYCCIDNQLVVLKDLPFLLDRKPLSRSGGWRRRRRRRRRI